MAAATKDMTRGKPAKLILTFALPLMLGSVFQQLYTMVDTMVVGRFIGVDALASLGAADWLNWMVLGIIMGFTQGFSILISQRFGAEDGPGLRKAVTMSVLLTGAIAVVTTVLSHLFITPTLYFLNTPENVVANAELYLRICFSGILIIAGYNILSSILRALGDSKTPLIAMVIAATLNIVLDLLFVVVFHWGVAGAAAATVIGQAFSCVYCLLALRKLTILKTTRTDWELDGPVLREIIRLGTPMAFQNGIIAVGGLVVQYVVNGFGFIFLAGFTATNKLYGLLELAATSFGFSMATYAGQNLGAKKYHRIRQGMNSALTMAIGTAAAISVLMIVFGRQILSLFLSGSPEEVLRAGNVAYSYLCVMSAPLFILYLLHLYRSALQGMGDTVVPMVSGIAELVMRIAIALTLPHFFGENGIFFAEVVAWMGADLLLIPAYYRRIRSLLPFEPPEKEPEPAEK